MKTRILYFVILIITHTFLLFSQGHECDTTIAPEIWSKPVILPERINKPFWSDATPFICADNKTLYYSDNDKLARSILTDTGWTEPMFLTDRINSTLVFSPSLSPDGKSLYFIGYTNGYWGWDIWRSVWSDSLNDWATPVRFKEDSNINQPHVNEWSVFISRDGKTMLHSAFRPDYNPYECGGMHDVYECLWNDSLHIWNKYKILSLNVNFSCMGDGSHRDDDVGSMPADNKKLYFSKAIKDPYYYELYVSYKNDSGKWEKAMRLNINSNVDTNKLYDPCRCMTGWDTSPCVTADGKTMYFTSRREAEKYGYNNKIWMSRLLVDEHGNIVTSEKEFRENLPNQINLLRNYPNPFNPSTKIAYELNKSGRVKLAIYDLSGKEVKKVIDEEQKSGRYETNWDSKDNNGRMVSSGVYFYRLQLNNEVLTRKMVLLR